ncbi:MAG: hypothetical protein AAFX99_20470, partial [Myxococcota bacterium]
MKRGFGPIDFQPRYLMSTDDELPPLDVPLSISARQLLGRSGLFSRRALRKIRDALVFEGGRRVGLKSRVALKGSVEAFVFGGQRFEVQVTVPPVVVHHKRLGTVTSHREGESMTV